MEFKRDAKIDLLEFLEWDEPDDEQFAQEVKIILVSAEFSKELTTSVMWLNDFGLDIRCVRIRPFINDGHIILDMQTIVPLPEVADYQVRIREKKQREREARNRSMDFTKFDVSIGGRRYEQLGKGRMIFSVVSHILSEGHGKPGQIIDAIPAMVKKAEYLFEVYDGKLSSDQFREQYRAAHPADGNVRYFIKDEELFHIDDKTYAFSNQWGETTREAVDALKTAFPELDINYERAEQA